MRARKVEPELRKICDNVLALKQKFDWDETAAHMNWCCGPETEGANVVGDATQDVQNLIEIKKQIVDGPELFIVEETPGVVPATPQERVSERVVEQIVSGNRHERERAEWPMSTPQIS